MNTGIIREGVVKTNEVSSIEMSQPRLRQMPQKPTNTVPIPTLYDCAHSTYRPIVGSVYKHDGKELQVFQSLDDGVMVKNEWYSRTALVIIVETKMKYVDDELLASGSYEYVGPYTYETVNKETRTIRHFKQVE